MFGKLLLALLLMIGVGIVLGLTDVLALEALGAILLMVGGALIALAVVVALVFALEGALFRGRGRWGRFH
ncbi:MAG TPA: hypothetical protein VFH78_15260 [Candidatus Thermoplasmatota archaeon]|nr:hypothetical protein [Candidatus Thermoplasmatota archaeon]